MRKLAVAALVLGLAGVAAAAAVHVKTSLCNGVCPLTGRPIAHHVTSAPAPVAARTGTAEAADDWSGSGLTAAAAAIADSTVECPKTHRRCCCPKAQECAEEATKPVPVQAPAQPTQNP